MKLLLMLLMLILVSCAGLKTWTRDTFEPKSKMDEVQESHKPLEKQRLIPRPGYEGHLTNRVCLKWYGSDCEKESIKTIGTIDIFNNNTIIRHHAQHIATSTFVLAGDQNHLIAFFNL